MKPENIKKWFRRDVTRPETADVQFVDAPSTDEGEYIYPYESGLPDQIEGTPFHYDRIDLTKFESDIVYTVGMHEVSHLPIPAVTDILPEAGDGSRKDANKVQGFYLIPQAPLFELAKLYKLGADKYSPRGWEDGMDFSRVIDALYRHVGKYLSGERYDATDGQHHMASVAWAAFAIMEYERTHPELDNIATSED